MIDIRVKSRKAASPHMTTLREYNPQVAQEWHPQLNGALTPDMVTYGSKQKVWWVGACNHEWVARVDHRASGRSGNCQVCQNRVRVADVNVLSVLYPEHAAEWWVDKNNGQRFDDFTPKSLFEATWTCELGHEWQAKIKNRLRTNGSNCPFCREASKITPGQSLAETYPEIAAEWDAEANGSHKPEEFSVGSGFRAHWKCDEGHTWQSRIINRTRGTHGTPQACPYCTNRSLSETNPLSAARAELAAEWHPTLNGNVRAEDVVSGSSYQAWWQCAKKGHEWQVTSYNRSVKGYGCPLCSSNASKGEAEVAGWLAEQGLTVERNNRKLLPGLEVDIWLPQQNLGVEYNGVYWHSEAFGKDREYHRSKYLAAQAAGIRLMQVWEDDWQLRPAAVKNMLLAQLQTAPGSKPAVAMGVEIAEAEVFLAENHVHGSVSGSLCYGLRAEGTDELLAVLVLQQDRKRAGDYTVRRYAAKAGVQDGFGTLLGHVERTLRPARLIGFSDNMISDGDLYRSSGFEVDGAIPPDYMYVVRGARVHKFNYRLKRFRTDPDLKWEEGLTERQLAELNGLSRVWDAGKIRWVKTFTV